jgi:hypothetical protein
MKMSSAQQAALQKILARASVDVGFRTALLIDPRRAIMEGVGVRIPPGFRVKFIERDENVDALIVLPDLERANGELRDDQLDWVSGGLDHSALW